MQRNWSTNVISGIGLLLVATMFCGPAKADEKTAALYKQKCAACHGADGKGETPTGKAFWDYYGYHEDPTTGAVQDVFAPRNFRGNLVTLSVRYAF